MVLGKKPGGKISGKDDSGNTIIEFPGGSKYIGELKNGMAHGYGTMYFADGRRLTGTFEKGKPHGKNMTLTFPDGRKYTGDYSGGKRHGYGKMVFPDGKEYEGEWKNDLPQGEGTMTHPDGSIEKGTWVRGKMIDPSAREQARGSLLRIATILAVLAAGIVLLLFFL